MVFANSRTAVYSSDGQTPGKFIESIRNALRSLAIINNSQTPIQLGDNSSHSISRTDAYLQLFHRQVSDALDIE